MSRAPGLVLIVRERILVHLSEGGPHERRFELPRKFTRDGIAGAARIEGKHVAQYVRPLIAKGLVEERWGHIQGGKERKKAYLLTAKGWVEAARFRGDLLETTVDVETEDGRRSVRLREAVKGPFKGTALLDVLRMVEAQIFLSVDGKAEGADTRGPAREPTREMPPIRRTPLGPPLVGRLQEMQRLRRTLVELKAGHGGCLVLTGEPGIGKSRLAQELAAEADRNGVLFLEGHTSEGQGSPSFVPWVELLRNLRSTVRADRLRDLLAPYAAVLSCFIPDLPAWIGRPAASLFPAVEFERFQLFDAITQVLASLSKDNPLILFIDDMQWADEASAQLLTYVHRNTLNERILFVVSYRPWDILGHRPAEDALYGLRRARRVEEISIGPLGREQAAQLAAGILECERVERNLTSVLVERGGGNPFFIQELLFSMKREGRIKVELGRAIVVGSNVRLPRSIEHLLRQRMARLSPKTRELLRMASVLGSRLRPQVLAGMKGQEWDSLSSLVDEALDSGFVREDPANPEGALVFVDEWIRACLYETTSQARRRAYHRLAARNLGAVPETSADELGYHYAKAGVAHLACKYLEAAGDEAMTIGSFKRAAERFEQVLRYLSAEDSSGRCRLLAKLGDAHEGAGRMEEARDAYLRARPFVKSSAEDAGLSVRIASVLLDLWDVPASHKELGHALRAAGEEMTPDAAWAYNLLSFVLADVDGDPEGSARAAQRAVEIASAVADRKQLLMALSNVVWAQMLTCRWEEARVTLARLEEAIREYATPQEQAWRHLELGLFYHELFPDYERALLYLRQALEISTRIGNARSAAWARFCLGLAHFKAGRWDEGERDLREALSQATDLPGFRFEVAAIQTNLAILIAHRGDMKIAEREMLAVLDSPGWRRRPHEVSIFQAQLAWLRAEAGNSSGARAAIRTALDVVGKHGGCGRCSCIAWTEAAHIETIDPDGDEEVFHKAERWVEERGNSLAKAKMTVFVTRWARLHGRPMDAGLEESEAYFRRIGDPFELAIALHEHGLTLVSLGSRSKGDDYLDEALRIFSGLGAEKWSEDVRVSRQRVLGSPRSA